MVIKHVWFIGLRRHFGEIAGKGMSGFFCLVGSLGKGFGVKSFGIFGLGGPGILGQPPCPDMLLLSFFMLWGWLTHGDFALEVGVDFLAVAEHRLIPARVRSEWSRLKVKGLASIWARACQGYVGNAGVGVISMRGAPLASLITIGRFGACFLLALGGSCI